MSPAGPPANRLRAVLDGPPPAVAVSFRDGVPDEVIAGAGAAGVDVAELRVDRFSSADPDRVEAEARRFSRLPTLATIRVPADGGEWRGDDAGRARLFERLLPVVDGIDVELESLGPLGAAVDSARAGDRVVVVSHHDFGSTPSTDRLDDLAGRARDGGADVVKLAVSAGSVADLRRLTAFLVRADHGPMIVIAMGRHGVVSRVCFPALGSRLTFAAPDESVAGSAPVAGQLSLAETVAMLGRFHPDYAARAAAAAHAIPGVRPG